MKIEIKYNQNIFYIFFILNLIGYRDDNGLPIHYLRRKILEDGKKYIDNKYIQKIKDINDKYEIYHSYLLNISIRSEIGFNTYAQDFNHLYRKDIKVHDRILKLVNKFINSTDIEKYFIDEIEHELKSITNTMNSGIKDLPIDREFEKYWGYLIPANGVVYINPFDAHGRAYGLHIDNTIISVTGTNDYNPDDESVLYFSDILVCSYIHEASHWYIDKYIDKASKKYNRGIKKVFNNILSKLDDNQRPTVTNHYNHLKGYIEESIVRVSESQILTPAIFKNTWSEQFLNRERENKLKEQISQGFIFSKEIMEILKEDKPMEKRIEKIYSMFININ